MNHKLPKDGSLDGVLNCTPAPLPHNAGMPRGFRLKVERVKPDGFSFGGVWITNPHFDESSTVEVCPSEYYGEAYLNWLEACQ